jgi:hypothetical protein
MPVFIRTMRLATCALVGAALASAVAFAQSKPTAKPTAVAGKYEGWARGSSQGDMALAVTLVQEADKLSGSMIAGSFSFSIYEGKIEGTKLTWSFSDGSITGTVEAAYKDGAVDGWWYAASESGSIQMKRAAK